MIISYPYGMLNSNIFLVSDGGEAMIVDCGGLPNPMLEKIKNENLQVKYIVLTHGHFDHICCVKEYLEMFPNATLIYHKDEHRVLIEPEANLSLWLGRGEIVFDLPHKTVCEGEIVRVGSLDFEVLHTPGHTPGGICLLCKSERAILTGDTLFENGYGRTDFKYGDASVLYHSLQRLYPLCQDGYTIYAGHDY